MAQGRGNSESLTHVVSVKLLPFLSPAVYMDQRVVNLGRQQKRE